MKSGLQHQSEGERGLAPFQKSRNGVTEGVANNIVPAQALYKSRKNPNNPESRLKQGKTLSHYPSQAVLNDHTIIDLTLNKKVPNMSTSGDV